MVYEAAQNVKIPVIGLGGIASGEDAAEFLIAGATAVEVGTATFWNPRAPLRIADELDEFMKANKVQSVRELVGTLRLEGGTFIRAALERCQTFTGLKPRAG